MSPPLALICQPRRTYLQEDAALARLGYGVSLHLLTVRAIEAHMTRALAGGTQTREEWRLRPQLKATMLDRGDALVCWQNVSGAGR
ncbi:MULTISPECIES: hypothetical protein [unclassified Kitasatospora]|uniref:hypothetical protein n=1 Tax=unclassified Kitasatospora TaxID=2633591 RepID=UPI0033F0323C